MIREQMLSENQKSPSLFPENKKLEGSAGYTKHVGSFSQHGGHDGYHVPLGGLKNGLGGSHGSVLVSPPLEKMYSYGTRGASRKPSGVKEAFGCSSVDEVR